MTKIAIPCPNCNLEHMFSVDELSKDPTAICQNCESKITVNSNIVEMFEKIEKDLFEK